MRATIFLVWLVPFLGATAFGADDLPQPKKDTSPPSPLPNLAAPRLDGEFSRSNPGELQRLIEGLRSGLDTLRSERTAAERDSSREASREVRDDAMERVRKRFEEAKRREEGRAGSVPPAAPPEASPPVVVAPPRRAEAPLPGVSDIIDPLAMARTLYRGGDYAAALTAFKRAEESFAARADEALRGRGEAPRQEERVPVKYMMATCLRKLGKTAEAEALYREVASSKGDEFVAECARWQLNTLSWKRQTEAGLAELRRRNKAAGDALKVLDERP